MTTRCMIVDDEPLARKVLQRHIATLPSLELVKQCGHAAEAAAYLHENGVDLIFLDIKMPGMSGMEFLNT
ncbi:MAG: response regulator, partial [Planctomycetes bacterium]|nr:response regulator [Planctomycetota bacterium]